MLRSDELCLQGPKMAKKDTAAATKPNKPVLSPVILSKEQQRVLGTVLQGSNVFFTGSAGTGKSFLLKRIIGAYASYTVSKTLFILCDKI